MPPEEARRKKEPVSYEILMVPHGEGGRTRSFRASRRRLWTYAIVALVCGFLIMIGLLVYTPLAMYIPINNPVLEARYGFQILETQKRLTEVAQDVLVLREYNQKLRQALGEFDPRDTSAARRLASRTPQRQEEEVPDESGPPSTTGTAKAGDYSYGDYDLGEGGVKGVPAVETSFRAALPLLNPTEGFVTQGFDPARNHFGIDYAAKRGTPVRAATDGFVVFAAWTFDDGNMVILSHGGGYLTVYKHNQMLFQSPHTYVKRGALIAESGSMGETSSGPHLHFEVWKDGVPLDPIQFLLTAPKFH
jgi:murein DD-endopeptidase MepM/ murein hydrolase activator NlpD